LAEVLLSLALAKGDIAPDFALETETLPLTRAALTTVSMMSKRPSDLWWRACHRHGNELRKAGKHHQAHRFLSMAADEAPDELSRLLTLVPLTRAQFQVRDQNGFSERLTELREALEDTSIWTPGFHPIAVLDTELRGSVIFDAPRRKRTHDLRRLIEAGGTITDPGPMAPQWYSIWAVSVCADALMSGQIDLAEHAALQALPLARREGLDRQLLRLNRVLATVEGGTSTRTIAELQAAARSVVAESR
jgi:hypothetical protein